MSRPYPRANLSTDAHYLGVGPGPKTRDGCSVDLYLRLPYGGEVGLFERRIPKESSVLELGCGVGRITRALLAQGYRVTAVDNSPEMLAHVPPGASRLCADIESLALDETFDAAIMASCLINTPDVDLRMAQLARIRRHLKAGGAFVFERFDPAWLETVQAGPLGDIGTVRMHVDEVSRSGAGVRLRFRYREGGDEWLQSFTAAILHDEDILRCLSDAGFGPPDWINRRWASATVTDSP